MFLKKQVASRNNNFLVGLSNDNKFLSALEKSEESKAIIIPLIKNEFSKLKNADRESIALRRAYIRICMFLETPKESLIWIEGILDNPNITEFEKDTIRRKIIPDLQSKLEKK